MCPADKEVFSSFAHAQVSITNEIYQYLSEPETFLFCPTGTLVQVFLRHKKYLLFCFDDLHMYLFINYRVLWNLLLPKCLTIPLPPHSRRKTPTRD